MSMIGNPRGPLPQRVYWVRRGLVLATAIVLIWGFAHLLASGSDGDKGATLSSGDPTGQVPEVFGSVDSSLTTGVTQGPGKTKKTKTATPLPAPTGPCDPASLIVDPFMDSAIAGSPIPIRLELRTTEVACSFSASSDTLAVTITSGSDFIWSTQQCPDAIADKDVVVRAEKPANVMVIWSARRSDKKCSTLTEWSMPGYYNIAAAAFGGESTGMRFRMAAPTAPTITRTVEPKSR